MGYPGKIGPIRKWNAQAWYLLLLVYTYRQSGFENFVCRFTDYILESESVWIH